MKLNMNNGHTTFFQINYRNTQANLCKNNFYLSTIKNDNGAVATRKISMQRKRKQKIHQLKKL